MKFLHKWCVEDFTIGTNLVTIAQNTNPDSKIFAAANRADAEWLAERLNSTIEGMLILPKEKKRD